MDDKLLRLAKAYVLKLLANREYSEKEIRDKLASRYDEDICNSVVESFLQQGFISNVRYSEMIIRHYVNRGYGISKIKFELMQKGVSAQLLQEYLENNEIDWVSKARMQLESHYNNIQDMDYLEKQKACAYLVRRGFTANEAIKALKDNNN